MPETVFRILLSSTFSDLEHHRARVREMIDRLQQASVAMETFGAQPSSPLETCRSQVERCDALIVIVGHRCGWIPEAGEHGADGAKSITRLEVEWALEAGKPVYAYLVDPNAQWHAGKETDRLTQALSEKDPLRKTQAVEDVTKAVESLEDFKQFLNSKVTRELFTSEDNLAGKAATSLANWIREQQAKTVVRTDGRGEPPSARDAAVAPRSWPGSPFPGLRAFTPADAPIFFGRKRETEWLLSELCNSDRRFLLVAGASGSGKSSLVAAGLIPRLASGAIPGSEDWLLPSVQKIGQGLAWIGLRFTPGELGPNPFQALAARLAPMLPGTPSPRDTALALESDPARLATFVDRALDGRSSRGETLLFIDQFEELITTGAGPNTQQRFVEMLTIASRSARVRVVATVRNDFWHRCIEAHPALADLLRERGLTVPLAVPGHSALVEMIEGPAACAGLRFDDGLVGELAEQTVSRPGGLALLAFALHRLYETRTTDGRLTRAVYDRFGGLHGVINERAEATFQDLPEPSQQQLGPVFSRLVVVDENAVATRQRAGLAELAGSSSDISRLIEAFEKARLLVLDAGGGTSVMEVAHEALLREWPRLAAWIRERADDLRLLQQTRAAALEWDRRDRTSHYLWPQERLTPIYESVSRLGRQREDLPDPERSFLRHEWEWLIDELERPQTTHQRRVDIGERLDRVGDPRPGVGLREDGTPEIVWCPIPGGVVELEGVGGNFDVAPFYMAKYPVTYRQYKAFLDADDGYRNKEHWKDLRREAEPGGQYRVVGNHPAENVSWYDAVAFCRWLSGHLGFEVRLPNDSEWQQAATGGNTSYAYAWGAQWDGTRANTWESRLGRTSAIGMYPHGASVQGVLDSPAPCGNGVSMSIKTYAGWMCRKGFACCVAVHGVAIAATPARRTVSLAFPAIAAITSGFV